MFAESDRVCEGCGRSWEAGFMLEFHHKIPLSDGGRSTFENASLLCRKCHLRAHFNLFKDAKERKNKEQMNANAYAIRKIKERIKEKSLYRYGKKPS